MRLGLEGVRGSLGELGQLGFGLHGPGAIGPAPGDLSEVVFGGSDLADFLVVSRDLVGFFGLGFVDHVEGMIEAFADLNLAMVIHGLLTRLRALLEAGARRNRGRDSLSSRASMAASWTS